MPPGGFGPCHRATRGNLPASRGRAPDEHTLAPSPPVVKSPRLDMRRAATCLAALLLAMAATARAGGLDLSWDHCSADGAVSNKAFACLSDAGEEALVGSFVLTAPMPGMVRLESTIEFQSATYALFPPWLYPGGCLALQASPDAPAPPANCPHWPSLGDPGTIAVNYSYPTPNEHSSVLVVTNTIAAPDPAGVPAGVEYQAFRIHIPHAGLVGAGTCGGCSDPLTIALSQVRLADGGRGMQVVNLPLTGTSSQVLWQSGGPVAARNRTWGAVKSLYRCAGPRGLDRDSRHGRATDGRRTRTARGVMSRRAATEPPRGGEREAPDVIHVRGSTIERRRLGPRAAERGPCVTSPSRRAASTGTCRRARS